MNYHIFESLNGYKDEILLLLTLFSIFFGIFVITSKNPIISILFLISLFLSISFYLMFLGIYFIGISYILVYIGAVSILFLFILMLINVRVSELLNETFNSLILSIIIALSFSIPVNKIMLYNKSYLVNENDNNIYTFLKEFLDHKEYDNIFYVCSESWDSNLIDSSYIISVGNVLYTNYSIWLILTSIILLLSMVGCILITVKR